ncbi:MAG: Brp/Blh family beta-carotene 15,15'-dioxygenase [Bacteroidota bacterium]
MNKKISIQLGIVFLIVVLYHLFAVHLSQAQYVICAAAILLFGIPHGAIDHLLERHFYRRENRFSSSQRFILWYVLCMAAYLVVWMLLPFRALLIFIALGIYHFGQEFIEESCAVPNRKVGFLLWGSLILVMPLLFHYEDSIAYVHETTKINLPAATDLQLNILAFSIPVVNLLYFSYLYFKKQIKQSVFMTVLAQLIVWTLVYWSTPFLIGFTLYFVVFHSFNSMQHQYEALLRFKKQYRITTYLRDLSAFTLLSYSGVVLLFFFIDWQQWQQLMLYSLVFISVLTLPHMMVFEHFYAQRKA